MRGVASEVHVPELRWGLGETSIAAAIPPGEVPCIDQEGLQARWVLENLKVTEEECSWPTFPKQNYSN
jgi:hypothetical protein